MSSDIDVKCIVSEAPVSSIAEDRLGLDAVATSMADTPLRQTLGEGFVVGVSGPWGAGEASLLNLVASRLGSTVSADPILGVRRPIVRRFNPWLVGAREALMPELFDVLVRAFEETYDPKHGVVDDAKTKVAELRRELQNYAGLLDAGAKITPAVETALHLPGLTVVLSVLKSAAKKPNVSLAEQKKRLVTLLREAPRRLVILVDDLDRLEPKEAVEVLRLVKAVADFPDTIYVLAFAPDLLAKAVERQLQVPNG